MTKSTTILLTFWSSVLVGCANTVESSIEPQWRTLDDLWTDPNEYHGEYVIVTGMLLFEELPYFESVVTKNNINPVIYVRLADRHGDAALIDSSFQSCTNEKLVRVFGRFRYLTDYESILENVYRVEAIERQAPSPKDVVCFSSNTGMPRS